MNHKRIDNLKKVIHNYIIDLRNGNIYSIKSRKYLKPAETYRGYKRVAFVIDKKNYNYCIHELVCFAAGMNLLDKSVNHINADKSDNSLYNLEVVTRKENSTHARDMNLYVTGEKHYASKLTDEQLGDMRRAYFEQGKSNRELAMEYNISRSHVSKLIRNQKRVTEGYEPDISKIRKFTNPKSNREVLAND